MGEVPEYSVIFLQLSLVYILSESLANPLITAQLATGKIRNYQIVVGGLLMLNFPIDYVFLWRGYSLEIVYYVAIIISVCCEIARIYLLRRMIGLSAIKFFREVIFNVVVVFIVALIISCVLKMLMSIIFVNFIVMSFVSVVCTMISVYMLVVMKMKDCSFFLR